MHSSEECDDGNLYNEDGCTEACTIENGYECDPGNERKPSECSPICGDGQLGLGEECDDGGKEDGDGCSSVCTNEEVLPTPGTRDRNLVVI